MSDVLQPLVERLQICMRLTNSLAEVTNGEMLLSSLPGLRSNTIGQQFWCVNGARESYSSALLAGKWGGFGNKLSEEALGSHAAVLAALRESQSLVVQTCEQLGERLLDPSRLSLVARLLEHEASHHGQLIRYWYGLNIGFPKEFATRYSLDQ